MNLVNIIHAIVLIPRARKHLFLVQKQLENESYKKVLKNDIPTPFKKTPIPATIKSYFWACRTIKACQCLSRSIALFQALKKMGYGVKHCIGVNKREGTLAAHAWVELNGEPLNEAKDLTDRFIVLKSSKEEIIDLNHNL